MKHLDDLFSAAYSSGAPVIMICLTPVVVFLAIMVFKSGLVKYFQNYGKQ